MAIALAPPAMMRDRREIGVRSIAHLRIIPETILLCLAQLGQAESDACGPLGLRDFAAVKKLLQSRDRPKCASGVVRLSG